MGRFLLRNSYLTAALCLMVVWMGAERFVAAYKASTIEPYFMVPGQSLVIRVPFQVIVNSPMGTRNLECTGNDPACVTIRNAVRDLLLLDRRDIDRVLDRYHLRIRDFSGTNMYPRP